MTHRYDVGQKVTIKPVGKQPLGPRDCTLEPYVGQIGEVIKYYWISPRAGEIFYIYLVRIGDGNKDIVLHEDEIKARID